MGFKEFDENNYRHMPVEKDDTCVKCNVACILKEFPKTQEMVEADTYERHMKLECKIANITQRHQRATCPGCSTFKALTPEDIGGRDKDDPKQLKGIIRHRNDDFIDQVNSVVRETFGIKDGHRSMNGYNPDPYDPHDWGARKRMEDLGTPIPPRRNKRKEKRVEEMRAEILKMKEEGLI